jgi:hypothetical protein
VKTTLFTVVWGPMVNWYLDGCLLSLLQPENLPKAVANLESYIIYTNAEEALKAHPAMQKFNEIFPVSYRPLLRGENHVNACTSDALQHCARVGTYSCIISPDHIYGNGSLSFMVELCRQEKADLIAYGFPRINFNAFPQLSEKMKAGETLSNRFLVRHAMHNLHYESDMN